MEWMYILKLHVTGVLKSFFIWGWEEQISSSCRETLRVLPTGNQLLITRANSKKVLRWILLHFTKQMSPCLRSKRWAVSVFWEMTLILQHEGRLVLLTRSAVKSKDDTLNFIHRKNISPFDSLVFTYLRSVFKSTDQRHLINSALQ